jgi:integrase
MVLFQLYTGARPGVTCSARVGEIQKDVVVNGATVWVYRPKIHKTTWMGHSSEIAIGPRAQEVLGPILEGKGTEEFIFSPRESLAARHQIQREKRKTPLTPSQRARKKKKNPEWKPGERFSVSSYSRRIVEVCKRHKIPRWHPHQLRHLAASMADHEFGIDGARAMLGHRGPQITTLYARRDLEKAAAVVTRIG